MYMVIKQTSTKIIICLLFFNGRFIHRQTYGTDKSLGYSKRRRLSISLSLSACMCVYNFARRFNCAGNSNGEHLLLMNPKIIYSKAKAMR